MKSFEDLLERYWNALNDEARVIELAPSYSGKSHKLGQLAREISFAKDLYDALIRRDEEGFEKRVVDAEYNAQWMKEFTGSLSKKKVGGGAV